MNNQLKKVLSCMISLLLVFDSVQTPVKAEEEIATEEETVEEVQEVIEETQEKMTEVTEESEVTVEETVPEEQETTEVCGRNRRCCICGRSSSGYRGF